MGFTLLSQWLYNFHKAGAQCGSLGPQKGWMSPKLKSQSVVTVLSLLMSGLLAQDYQDPQAGLKSFDSNINIAFQT